MPAAGLRVLYAQQMLDGGLLPLFPGGRTAKRSGSGGFPIQRGRGARHTTLSRLRQALSTRRQDALLLGGLFPRRPAAAAAGIHEEKAGLNC